MIRTYRGVKPRIDPSAYVEETAIVIGDVAVGPQSSLWFRSVVRGDVHSISIGARSNIQDLCMLHVQKDEYGLTIGDDVTVGHGARLHGCVIHDTF